MTTYQLKDTREQLIKRKMTQRILFILKNSEKKWLTKMEIYRMGKKRNPNDFNSDPKGITVMRYLKTMSKYGLVEDKKSAGKTTLWKLIDMSKELHFQTTINNHIYKLNNIAKSCDGTDCFSTMYSKDDKPDYLHWKTKKGVTIYGSLISSIIDKKSKENSELNEIFKIMRVQMNRLSKLNKNIYRETNQDVYKEVRKSCNSYIDEAIAMIYYLAISCQRWEHFDIDETNFVNFDLFERNTYPYVVKANLSFLEFVIDYYHANYNKKISKKELWEKLDGYKVNQKLSYGLYLLHCFSHSYMINQTDLTVVCDYGDEIIFKEIIDYDLMRRAQVQMVENRDIIDAMVDISVKKFKGELTDEEIEKIFKKDPLFQKMRKKQLK